MGIFYDFYGVKKLKEAKNALREHSSVFYQDVHATLVTLSLADFQFCRNFYEFAAYFSKLT
jgi:hypothetical protein